MSNQKAAINGAKWTTTAIAINTGLSFLQLAIIARFLDPSIFGLVSICSMVMNFFHIFANLGFTKSIISIQENDRKILSTIFYASVGIGFIMGLLIFFSSGYVAHYYDEPRLSYVIKISSISFPLIYLGQIYNNLLQKELKFKILATVDVVAGFVGIILTVGLAYKGFQELSIIYSQIFCLAVKTLMYMLFGKKLFSPVFYFKLNEIKDHLRFGMYHIGEGILSFANGNLENIVIGKAIGVKELGLYTVAYQLAVFPVYKLVPIIMQVTYPIMAKIKDDEGLKRAYVKIIDFITYVNFPLLAGLFITSSTVVVLIYGQDYAGSVPLTRVILFVSIFACINAPASALSSAKNQPQYLFYLNIFTLAIKIPTLYLLSKYFGLMGIVYGYVLNSLIETIFVYLIIEKLVGSFLKQLMNNLIKPLSFCLAMIAVIFLYQQFIGNHGVFHLVAQIIIGVIIYAGFTLKYKMTLEEILTLKKSL